MPKTNAPEHTFEFHQPPSETSLQVVLKYSQHRFLCEFIELTHDVCEGVTACLEVVEKGEAAARKSNPENKLRH